MALLKAKGIILYSLNTSHSRKSLFLLSMSVILLLQLMMWKKLKALRYSSKGVRNKGIENFEIFSWYGGSMIKARYNHLSNEICFGFA